jgi:transposase InsO family protein
MSQDIVATYQQMGSWGWRDGAGRLCGGGGHPRRTQPPGGAAKCGDLQGLGGQARGALSRGRLRRLATAFSTPKSCAHAVAPDVQAAILELRHELEDAGHDHGPHTIAHHLALRIEEVPSVATIWRILKRHGLITPQPQKRPKASFIRFAAHLPNELWQADTTHWHLADGSDVEILDCIDDHSRMLLIADAFVTVKAADVVASFASAWLEQGFPAALLTDNGAVFSGKSRKSKVLLESELERLGIVAKHSAPYHPQTCGKVERFHRTLKRYLGKQPPPPSLSASRPGRRHTIHGLQWPPQSAPWRDHSQPHFRVRQDKADVNGTVTLRYLSRLHVDRPGGVEDADRIVGTTGGRRAERRHYAVCRHRSGGEVDCRSSGWDTSAVGLVGNTLR